DRSLLIEAREKFPGDPRVAFAAASMPGDSPEEHRKWIENFKQSAPDNAAGEYLSAADYFKSGQSNLALLEVQSAINKPLRNYYHDFIQEADEAYRAAGYSEAQAKALASFQLLLPELAQYKQVGVNLASLAQSYQQTGDTASAQAT